MCGPIFDERSTTVTEADRRYQASRGFQPVLVATVTLVDGNGVVSLADFKPLSESPMRALARGLTAK
jgi:hypothetical protein